MKDYEIPYRGNTYNGWTRTLCTDEVLASQTENQRERERERVQKECPKRGSGQRCQSRNLFP